MSLPTPLLKCFKDNTDLGKWLIEVLLEKAPELIIPPEWLDDLGRNCGQKRTVIRLPSVYDTNRVGEIVDPS